MSILHLFSFDSSSLKVVHFLETLHVGMESINVWGC